jgi:hypothetical protein
MTNRTHKLHKLLFTGWHRTRSSIHCDHYCSIVLLHLSSNHSDSPTELSDSNQQTPSSKAEETWREVSVTFPTSITFILQVSLKCRKILRNGTIGFTSPPKEVMLRILSPLKIHLPRPGLNPRTFCPVASTLTTVQPRATNGTCIKFGYVRN